MMGHLREACLAVLCAAMLLAAAGCGGGGNGLATVDEFELSLDKLQLTPVDNGSTEWGDPGTLKLSTTRETGGWVVEVRASGAENLTACHFELAWSTSLNGITGGEGRGLLNGDYVADWPGDTTAATQLSPAELFAFTLVDDNRLVCSVMSPWPNQQAGFSGSGVIARFHFADGSLPVDYLTPEETSAGESTPYVTRDFSAIGWTYINEGDIDEDGTVGPADLAWVARMRGMELGAEQIQDYERLLELNDLNGDGTVDAADLHAIHRRLGLNQAGGYDIYYRYFDNTGNLWQEDAGAALSDPVFVKHVALTDGNPTLNDGDLHFNTDLPFDPAGKLIHSQYVVYQFGIRPLDAAGTPGEIIWGELDAGDGTGGDIPEGFQWPEGFFGLMTDSTGLGYLEMDKFTWDSRLLLLAINCDPDYLDAHVIPGTGAPELTPASFTVTTIESPDDPAVSTVTPLDWSARVPSAGRRAVEAAGDKPRECSAIQKGELRAFTRVPATDPPVVLPPEDDPQMDTSGLSYPDHYTCQLGRLVSIGAHCLVFLTYEINDGYPDTITNTEARINRLARAYDNDIYPVLEEGFGEVQDFSDPSIWSGIDLDVELHAGDFVDGEPPELPGSVDTELALEEKTVIFLYNGDGTGGHFPPAEQTPWGNTLYLDASLLRPDDGVWELYYCELAWELQRKLYADHGLPVREGAGPWLRDLLSSLAMIECGYTPVSGKLAPWIVEDQLAAYLADPAVAVLPADVITGIDPDIQAGGLYHLALYLADQYLPGAGRRIYELAASGETDFISLAGAGAAFEVLAGDDIVTSHDDFQELYARFCAANVVNRLYGPSSADEFNWLPFYSYNYTDYDQHGTYIFDDREITLPGLGVVHHDVSTEEAYPSTEVEVMPWSCACVLIEGGTGQDVAIEVIADPELEFVVLPLVKSGEEQWTVLEPE